jgi:hypothetical protein
VTLILSGVLSLLYLTSWHPSLRSRLAGLPRPVSGVLIVAWQGLLVVMLMAAGPRILVVGVREIEPCCGGYEIVEFAGAHFRTLGLYFLLPICVTELVLLAPFVLPAMFRTHQAT